MEAKSLVYKVGKFIKFYFLFFTFHFSLSTFSQLRPFSPINVPAMKPTPFYYHVRAKDFLPLFALIIKKTERRNTIFTKHHR
jgi:hypothetical protein